MKHISIYWTNDSDELLDMLRELGDPGETIGNEGCELAVTDSEFEQISEYAAAHPDQIRLEVHGTLTDLEAQSMSDAWHETAVGD